MNRMIRFAAVAVIGLALGAGFAWLTRGQPPAPDPEGAPDAARVGDPRPDFRHAALDGRYVEAADFDGRPLLINFWATWCAPCVREMPLLDDFAEQEADRLAVIGIAIDDPGAVAPFVEELGVDYPILVGTTDVMRTQRRFGNTAGLLPYTVLVDADGTIAWQFLGEVKPEHLEREVRARLSSP
ncbi:TlpA family protein disulfide reductase [Wenzhouxiangella sp. XN79A]|uniref:TlpA family protein disulfide reductase n=1 Tax=Wenzhouxiangella sp. XN79A TaxID=2724193 RepID=UPI00144A977E|nr:TlpA disulfide reductase family protein [Wenzhouxiangella sp. XN79A]NKI33577.1 TlpA family protein disulfide reductase [Wenzhouxiangella sp. XN79A]